MTPKNLIQVENGLVKLWESGDVNSLIHFSGSTDGLYEDWICRLFRDAIKPGDWICASHRAHYVYLLYCELNGLENPEQRLIESVLAGRSMFLYGPRFIQSAIVAGLCGIACGLAMSIKARGGKGHVWCFGGDGMEDQGGFYEAVHLADGRDLPVTYLIEDNARQCGVSREARKAQRFEWPKCVVRHEYDPKYPHAGTSVRPNLKSQTPPRWLVQPRAGA